MSPNQVFARRVNLVTPPPSSLLGKGGLEQKDENDVAPRRRSNRSQLQSVLENLTEVETALQSVLQKHRHGTYGFVTKEWGFTAPGGLGGQLKGKFYPWEFKLRKCRTFFWPIECYEAMEEGPDFGKPDPDMIKDLPPEAEQLYRNTPLHNFLKEPPMPVVRLVEADYRDYRSAARIFLLLGTLSHLYGNSAPNGPKTAALPEWIEDPLREVAKRLRIEPTLSGHFLVQENWIWKSDSPEESESSDDFMDVRRKFQKRSSITLSKRRLSKNTSRRVERKIVGSLLRECKCEDRLNGLKMYSDCFLGSECVDVVMDHRYCQTREEAVRLVRKLNRGYKLFTHVTNKNYELMDKRYLYRFRKEWKTRRFMAVNGDLADSSIEFGGPEDGDDDRANRSVSFGPPPEQSQTNGSSYSSRPSLIGIDQNEESSISSKNLARLSSSYDSTRIVPKMQRTMHDNMSVIYAMSKVKVKDRRYRLRIYRKCFVGKQLIDVLFEHECGTTRKDCLEIALHINQRFHLFEHVKHHHLLKDKHLFYRFTEGFRNMIENQTHASTLVEAGGRMSGMQPRQSGMQLRQSGMQLRQSGMQLRQSGMQRRRSSTPRRVSFSEQPMMPSVEELAELEELADLAELNEQPNVPSPQPASRHNSADEFVDENLRPSLSRTYSDYGDSYDMDVLGIEEEMEFSLDNITMLYPAFGNNHERVNQLVPACMGFSLSSLPFDVLDILSAMRDVLEAELNFVDDGDNYEINRLYDLVYKVAFSVSKCKEEFQQMSTDPKKRSFNSKYVSIKQTQPLSNGVLVRRSKDSEPEKLKGTTGTQFPYFHILDWLLGRFQFQKDGGIVDKGFVAAVGSIDDTFPPPQREFIRCLTKLEESSCLRGFLEVIGRPNELLTAYNHLIECYAGEGGMLQAHCRKLYSYIHNNVQSSTSGTTHLAADAKKGDLEKNQSKQSGCPMSTSNREQPRQSGCPMSSSSQELSTSNGNQPKQSGCPMSSSSQGSSTSNGEQPKQSGCPMSSSGQFEQSGCPMSASKESECGLSSTSDESLNSESEHLTDESLNSESEHSVQGGCPMSSSSNAPMKSKNKQPEQSGCPMSASANASANAIDNHKFAIEMFKHMRMAADDRWKLRLPPLMNEVGKVIYSTSESGGFTTVALDLTGTGLLYEYGDVVKVILPNDDKQTLAWLHSLKSMNKEFFKVEEMEKLQQNKGNGWGWAGLWEALGWNRFEENGGKGVPLETVARYIEQGNIRDEASNIPRWVHSPLDLSSKGSSQMFASPPPIPTERIVSLEPVSPRIYSVSGVEIDRVFLLVSKPDDLARHHGYSSMSDPNITKVHCSFSPATFFLVPPKDTNLVCIASGTGISPFVGLVDSIGSRTGSYTIVHQCKSSDMFMCNSQTWLDFTAMNPGAIVMGYISGDRSRRNCPMRYIIRNGAFEETTVLRRNRISAYYFECDLFQNRIFETYSTDSLNLAYCCGGVKSAIMPMQNFANSNGMDFEFTSESYGVPVTLTKASNLLSQIGGTIIDLNHVSPIHPGGDQILRQAHDITTSMEEMKTNKKSDTPDHSIAFYELHPHAYNLHRCLRTPVDADSKAFAKFLERQAMTKSVLGNMATKYAQAVLSAPEKSKIVKIATELQSSAISAQMDSGDTEGAQRTASYLQQLLAHVPDDDDDTGRWERSLDLLPTPSKRKSSVRFGSMNVPDSDDEDIEPFGSSSTRKSNVRFGNINSEDEDIEPFGSSSRRKSNVRFGNINSEDEDIDPFGSSSRRKSNVRFGNINSEDEDIDPFGSSSRRKSSVAFNVSDDDDDDDGEGWGQSHDLMPPCRRKSSMVFKTLEP